MRFFVPCKTLNDAGVSLAYTRKGNASGLKNAQAKA